MQIPIEKPGTPEELVHYGVLGMKWGHRKGGGESSGLSKSDRKAEKKFVDVAEGGKKSKAFRRDLYSSVEHAATIEAARINAKPQYMKALKDGKLNSLDNPIAKKYVKEHNDAVLKLLNNELSQFRSPTGRTLKAHVDQESDYGFSVRIEENKSAKHADSLILKFEYIKNKMGKITGYNFIDNSMTQTAIADVNIEAKSRLMKILRG